MANNNLGISIGADTSKAKQQLNVFAKEMSHTRREVRELTAAYEQLDDAAKQSNLGKTMSNDLQQAIKKYQELNKIQDKVKENLGSGMQVDGGKFNMPNLGGFSAQLDGLISKVPKLGGLIQSAFNPATAAIGAATGGIVAYYEAMKPLEKMNRNIQNQTGLDQGSATTLGADAKVLSGNFDDDVNEVLKTANVLMREFGVTGQEAMQLIQDGYVNGANSSNDMLDTLREYPTQLKNAGLNAQQMLAIMIQASQQGVFSDKAIDSIKEANLRLREMPKATSEALDAIGIDSKKVQKELLTGQTTTMEVIQQVSKKLADLGEQGPGVGQAIADIFGGPGEDAGYRYLSNLKDISLDLDEVKKKHEDLNGPLNDEIEAHKRLQEAEDNIMMASKPLFNALQSGWTNILNILATVLNTMNSIITSSNKVASAAANVNKATRVNRGDNADAEVMSSNVKRNKKGDIDRRYYNMSSSGHWTYTDLGAEEHNRALDEMEQKTKKVTSATKKLADQYIAKSSGSSSKSNKKTEEVLPKGSIADLNKQISELQKKRDRATDPTKINELNNKIKELKDNVENLNFAANQIDFNKKFGKISGSDIKQSDLGSLTGKIEAPKEVTMAEMGFDEKSAKTLGDKIKDMNDQNAESFKKSIEAKEEFNDKMRDGVQGLESFGSLYDSITSIGEAFENVEDPIDAIFTTFSALGQVIDTVSTAITSVQAILQAFSAVSDATSKKEVANANSETAANTGKAFTGAIASGAKLAYPANLVAIATGVAAVVAALAMIASFATGGIAGGSQTMGDNTLVRVNKGEMMLNNRQQAHLFKMLDSGIYTQSGATSGNVEFRISGSNLYGSLKNYSKTQSKIGKTTGIH